MLVRRYGMRGHASAVHTACASGGQAIGQGIKLIRRGAVDAVLAGGFDSMVNPVGLAGFCLLGVLSSDNNTPERASRPFDRTRNGFVLGEGAGFVVLEEWQAAQRRGARIYAELAGDGNSLSSYRITDSHPSGKGPMQAMQWALGDARASIEQVDYINAHGTSTPMNDRSECAAIHAVFGRESARIAVSSTKALTGHLIAAAGAVEAAICALVIRDGIIPLNGNLVHDDPECTLNFVRQPGHRQRVRVAVSNAFGFGGSNNCLVFRHPQEVPEEKGPRGRGFKGPREENIISTLRTLEPSDPRTIEPFRRERIVITGRGVICAAGRTPQAIWTSVRSGCSAIAPIQRWDAAGWRCARAGEVLDEEPATLVPDRKVHKLVRRTDLFGLYAAAEAIRESGVTLERQSQTPGAAIAWNERSGVFVGAGGGAYEDQYDYLPLLARADGSLEAFGRELMQVVHPMWLLRSLPNNVLCHVGIMHGFSGPNACITNHSTSGAMALVEAVASLRAGEADRAVVVAHHTPVEPELVRYYDALGVLTADAMRPFDATRSGCLLGEGAAAVLLETESVARARGAAVLGEFLGAGCVTEGEGLLAVRADGDGVVRAVELALADAKLTASDVGAIVAHGNATPHGDTSEAAGLQRIFGHAMPPVTAFKWSFGHLLAAAGILDTVVALTLLRDEEVPGIATLGMVAKDCHGVAVSRAAQRPRSNVALVLCRGFGGLNVALLLRGTGDAPR